ncbi:delta12-fatty acid desaturase [Wolfiporia cocos MD-104 SS10]|uniref:Delta12-fatty acid desaturase n=1 Tax=Wolfiporia cocos (strain MD-104) TaxID=742152 RepID=A0A2H3JDK4_WOLCO|nr:delta12-fatty acid desaturase [Wolfiporia cocos MD-104 SS10]
MAQEACDAKITAGQIPFLIPTLSTRELLSAIPAHCYKRSVIRSMSYVIYDFCLLAAFYKLAGFLDTYIAPEYIALPGMHMYTMLHFALWTLYSFLSGLVMMGIWVLAHECGHQAFSDYRAVNHTIGWILHSGLGVLYHSWRISHAKHHASNGHMTQDQVFVPKTRSQLGLPAFDASKETIGGASVTEELKQQLWEACGDSPIGAGLAVAKYLFVGWFAYIFWNASGQHNYPRATNHFNPSAVIFAPRHRIQIMISTFGYVLWLAAICSAIHWNGFTAVFRVYLFPYLWANHWLILITFLQHTDPLLPHYRASDYTFPRGALVTLDRSLLGGGGRIMGWLGAHLTHGISETHVAHHVSSKIPHYHAWEVTDALRKRLAQAGLTPLQGRPGGWSEMYRVYRECKFVEDEGGIVFYKNAFGLAHTQAVFVENSAGTTVQDNEKA